MPEEPRQSWRRRAGRLLVLAGFCYLGVLLVLLALENSLLYRADVGRAEWLPPPPGLTVEEMELDAGGTTVHCWWSAPPGWEPGQGALLYCHGNAGNLSHRGSVPRRWQKTLGVGVLLFDYPGYG